MAPVVLGDGATAVKGTCEGGLALHTAPEKALAALTGHGVEVEASGFVATNTTDSWNIPIEFIRGHSGRTHNRGLHH